MCLVWSLNTIKKSGSFFYIHFEFTQMILHYRSIVSMLLSSFSVLSANNKKRIHDRVDACHGFLHPLRSQAKSQSAITSILEMQLSPFLRCNFRYFYYTRYAQPNRKLYDVLTKGSGDAREQPLFFIITTAGNDKNSICYELHTKALDLLDDRKSDPTFYPVVYGLTEEDDWTDESTES